MSDYNFWGLDLAANSDPLELSSPPNAPGKDKKIFQLPILSHAGKVFQDFYSLAPAWLKQGDVFSRPEHAINHRPAAHRRQICCSRISGTRIKTAKVHHGWSCCYFEMQQLNIPETKKSNSHNLVEIINAYQRDT
jgi:hypothetical protein